MIYNHIVAAIDEARPSRLALKHAVELTRLSGAQLTLLTVVNPTEFMALSPEFLRYENYEVAAQSEGEHILNEAEQYARHEGLQKVDKKIIISTKGVKDMAEKLIRKAEESGADLIVLGTHGRTGLMHFLMGSFAETVLRQTTLPVLILRSRASEEDEEENDTQDKRQKKISEKKDVSTET